MTRSQNAQGVVYVIRSYCINDQPQYWELITMHASWLTIEEDSRYLTGLKIPSLHPIPFPATILKQYWQPSNKLNWGNQVKRQLTRVASKYIKISGKLDMISFPWNLRVQFRCKTFLRYQERLFTLVIFVAKHSA